MKQIRNEHGKKIKTKCSKSFWECILIEDCPESDDLSKQQFTYMCWYFRPSFENPFHMSTCYTSSFTEDSLVCGINSWGSNVVVNLLVTTTLLICCSFQPVDVHFLDLAIWAEALSQVSDCWKKSPWEVNFCQPYVMPSKTYFSG